MGFLDFEKPETLPQWLIFIAATGITLSSPYGTRQFIKELKKYLENKTKQQNSSVASRNLSQAIHRLRKRKLISINTKNGVTRIVLTEKGRVRKLEYDINRLKVPKPEKWDGKWRFLLFDIPEKRRAGRDLFRKQIERLGFLQFQRSVWVYPYPCEKEVDFLAEKFGVASFMTLLTVTVERDIPLRKHFDL